MSLRRKFVDATKECPTNPSIGCYGSLKKEPFILASNLKKELGIQAKANLATIRRRLRGNGLKIVLSMVAMNIAHM